MRLLMLTHVLIFSLFSTQLQAQTISRSSTTLKQLPKSVAINKAAPLCQIDNFKYSDKLIPGGLFFVSTQPKRAAAPVVARTGNQVLYGIPADAQQATTGPTIRKVYFSYEVVDPYSHWRVASVETVQGTIPSGTTDWVEFRVPPLKEPFLPQTVTVHVETSQCNTQFSMAIEPKYVRQRWFPPVNASICSQPEGPNRHIWREFQPGPTSQTRFGGKRTNFCGPWTTYHLADPAITDANGRVSNKRLDMYEIWHGGVARDVRVGIVYLKTDACTFEETITQSGVTEGQGGPYVLKGKIAKGVTRASTNVTVNWYSKTTSGAMCPYHLMFEALVPHGFPTEWSTPVKWTPEGRPAQVARISHDQTSSVFRWFDDNGQHQEQRLNLK